MRGILSQIAIATCLLGSAAASAAPQAHSLNGVWYGTHAQQDLASAPLHWKLWRNADGRFVVDYYVQAGCFLSYSHRESGRWAVRGGVTSVVTEKIGEHALSPSSKGYLQRFKIIEAKADSVRVKQTGADADLLLTRIPADFKMSTLDLCPAESAG